MGTAHIGCDANNDDVAFAFGKLKLQAGQSNNNNNDDPRAHRAHEDGRRGVRRAHMFEKRVASTPSVASMVLEYGEKNARRVVQRVSGTKTVSKLCGLRTPVAGA